MANNKQIRSGSALRGLCNDLLSRRTMIFNYSSRKSSTSAAILSTLVPLHRHACVCVYYIRGGCINIHRCRRVTQAERGVRTIKLISTCGRPLLLLLSFPLSLLVSHNSRVTLLLREKSHLHTLMLGHNTFRGQRESAPNLRSLTKELCPENFCVCHMKA